MGPHGRKAEVTTLDPKLKGVQGGNCNRTACQKPGATWFNRCTQAYYCRSCARLINEGGDWQGEPICYDTSAPAAAPSP